MNEKLRRLLRGDITAVNVGLDLFADHLEMQGVETIRVKFSLKPKIEKELQDILDKII